MAKRTPIRYGALPSVDLLPDAQRAEKQHEATLPKLLLTLVASAVVAGLIWAGGMIPVFTAQQELSQANARSAALSAEMETYSEARDLLQGVGSRETDRQVLTADEVMFIDLRDEIAASLPDGTTLTTYEAALPGGDAATEGDLGGACLPTGATATVTLAAPGDSDGLARAARFIDGVRNLDGFECGTMIGATVLSAGDSVTTEVQVRFVFNETVRANRFVEGDEQ